MTSHFLPISYKQKHCNNSVTFKLRFLVLNFYGLTVTDFSHSIHILVLERLKLRLRRVSFIYYIFDIVATTFITLHPLQQNTALQTRRTRVRFLMVSLDFSLTILLAALWPWG
jgi:hypothetical protein